MKRFVGNHDLHFGDQIRFAERKDTLSSLTNISKNRNRRVRKKIVRHLKDVLIYDWDTLGGLPSLLPLHLSYFLCADLHHSAHSWSMPLSQNLEKGGEGDQGAGVIGSQVP